MLSFQECKRSTVWIRQRAERLVKGYKVTLVSDAHSTFDTEVLRAEDIVKHHNVVFGAFGTSSSRRKETVSKRQFFIR